MANAKMVVKMSEVSNVLKIKNFKSLRDVEIGTSRVNIFFGKPNSGKSNLLEALTLFNVLQDKQKRLSAATLIRYNTLDNLFYDRDIYNDISVSYNNNEAILTYYAAANDFLQLVNPAPALLDNLKAYFEKGLSFNEFQDKIPDPEMGTMSSRYSSIYVFLDESGNIIARFNSTEEENPIRRYEFKEGIGYADLFRKYLKSSGENLFTIVQENSKIKEWISRFFEEFNLEFLIDFSSKKFEIQKKERGIVYKIPFELTPDTLRRMLFYVAAIYSNKGCTILMEEPEAHSFPPYIKELSELIKEDTANRYFITTHSPYFINSLIEDSQTINDITFNYVYYEDYQTKVKQLTQQDLDIVWGSGVDVFFNIDALAK